MDIFIDESGSVHPTNKCLNRYFIIGIILSKDTKKLLKSYKIFVRKNLDYLQKIDKECKMFDKNGKFKELKGSSFNRKLKLDFLEFFLQKNEFQVAYILLDNNRLEKRFISNKARTFNYLLKLYFENYLQWNDSSVKNLYLNIDERNVKTDSKFSLEDYLNQELVLNMNLLDNVTARYYDSSQNKLIQIADVFSNIMYSNIMTRGVYNDEIKALMNKGIILPIFKFPKDSKKDKKR